MIRDVNKWTPLTLLLLPALPILYWFPTAIIAASILMVIIALRISSTKEAVDLVDIAFGVLFLVVFSWTVSVLMSKGIGGVNIAHTQWWLLASGGLILNNLSYKNNKTWTPIYLICILGWFIWVLLKGYGRSYEELTYLLSYTTGVGNISQIAMYAACTVLLFAINSRQQSRWMFLVLLVATTILAWIIKSKLLFAVNLLALIDYCEGARMHRWSRLAVAGLITLTVIAIVFFKPNSLSGRLALLQTGKDHIQSILPFGMGLGQNAAFFNQLFAGEIAVNTVGAVDRFAFNEYLQATIEMGIGGLACLTLLTIAVWRGRSPWLATGWILMAVCMFPLQYAESGLLWIFCGIILNRSGNEPGIRMKISIRPLVYKTLAVTSLVCSLYFFLLHVQLFKADQDIEQGNMTNGLTTYEKLLPFWKYSPDFRLKYGHWLETNNNTEAAIIQYRYSMGISPSYPAAIQLADTYFDQSMINNAINYYELAHRLRPAHLYPLYRLVWCYYNTGDHEAMQRQYEVIKETFSSAHVPLQMQMLDEIETLYSSIAQQMKSGKK